LPNAPDDPIARRALCRTLGLRQLRNDEAVRGVDQVLDLIGRNRPVQGEGVPAVLTDVGHLAGNTRITRQQEIGGFPIANTSADRRVAAQESKNLVTHLGDEITFPGLVLPGARFGETIVAPLRPSYHVMNLS